MPNISKSIHKRSHDTSSLSTDKHLAINNLHMQSLQQQQSVHNSPHYHHQQFSPTYNNKTPQKQELISHQAINMHHNKNHNRSNNTKNSNHINTSCNNKDKQSINNLVNYLCELMEDQVIVVIRQFQQQYDYDIDRLIAQVGQIKQEMRIVHAREIRNLTQQQRTQVQQQVTVMDIMPNVSNSSNYASLNELTYSRSLSNSKNDYKYKPNTQMLKLTRQIDMLISMEDYIGASSVQNQLLNQIQSNNRKKHKQIQRSRQARINALNKQHKIEYSALQHRLQLIVQQTIKSKQKQLHVLLNKLKVAVAKTQKNLQYSSKYMDDIAGALNIQYLSTDCPPKRNNNNKYSLNSTNVHTALNTRRPNHQQKYAWK